MWGGEKSQHPLASMKRGAYHRSIVKGKISCGKESKKARDEHQYARKRGGGSVDQGTASHAPVGALLYASCTRPIAAIWGLRNSRHTSNDDGSPVVVCEV